MLQESSAKGKLNLDNEDNRQTKARRSTRATNQNKKVIESGRFSEFTS